MTNDSFLVLGLLCCYWSSFVALGHICIGFLFLIFHWLLAFFFFFFFELCLLVVSFALYFWWMGSHPWFLYTWFLVRKVRASYVEQLTDFKMEGWYYADIIPAHFPNTHLFGGGGEGIYNMTLPQQRWQQQEVWNYTVKPTHFHCMIFPISKFRSIRDGWI